MDFLVNSFSAFGHDDAHQHYQNIYYTEQVQPHHKASWTHEAVAGAAGFAAMRAYESHLRATGHQPSHELMKELLAGIAAAEIDKLVETKGLDWVDRHKAKKMAAKQAHELAHHRYAGGSGWEYAQAQGGYAAQYEYSGGVPWGAQGHGGYGQPQGAYYPPPQGYPLPAGYGAPQQGYYGGQPGYGGPTPGVYQGGYQGGYQDGYAAEEHRHHHGHHHHHG